MREPKIKNQKPEEKVVTVKSEAKFLKISPRKLRLVVNEIKKFLPQEALRRLKFLNKRGARVLSKAIKTAIYDAKNNFGISEDSLKFQQILVNEGPRVKRIDKSHGARFDQGIIRKRMSHLLILVEGEKKNGQKS